MRWWFWCRAEMRFGVGGGMGAWRTMRPNPSLALWALRVSCGRRRMVEGKPAAPKIGDRATGACCIGRWPSAEAGLSVRWITGLGHATGVRHEATGLGVV